MARRTSLEMTTDVIIRWFEENHTTATSKELETELKISHSSMWNAMRYLEDKGAVRAANPNQRRNVIWEYTGNVSRMPTVKDDNGSFVPVTVIWHSFSAFAHKTPDKFIASYPRHLAFVGVVRYFYAAIQASMDNMHEAKETVGAARRVLFQARKNAIRDLEMIDRLLADPKLNVNSPRQLIPVLLEDKQFPVDVYKMWNEDAQTLIKMIGNKA